MGVGDLGALVLGFDEAGYVLHWAGSVECDHGSHVVDGRRFKLLDVSAHPRAFQLKDAGGLSAGEDVEGLLVVEGNVVKGHPGATALGDDVEGLAKDGEVNEAEEVHLQEAQLGDWVHRELGYGYLLAVVAGCALERDVVGEGFLGDDDARSVGAGVAGHALQLLGGVDELADGMVLVVVAAKVGAGLHGFVDGLDPEGHLLGHVVDDRVGHSKGAPDVPEGGACAKGAEGDDLGDVLGAVLAGDVGDDFVPAVVLEIQVDIGHFLALDVEETFKYEAVLEGVDVGDAQAVED